MRVFNNMAAMAALNENNRNLKKSNKSLAQLALGERIAGAGDDVSGYAISEKMRVEIRGLGQDDQNVKNGASMLRVAEGAIQSQINLLRTVKERVINANNDTNTDADRAIIQKEIDQYYDEIQDIAASTTFNGQLLLLGDSMAEKISSWVVLDRAVPVEESDELGLIRGTSTGWDGEEGQFNAFSEWKSKVEETNLFTGGTASVPASMYLDLMAAGAYSDVDSLDGVGFYVGSYSNRYILTKDPGKEYNASATKIDISGCGTIADVASKINATISGSSIEGTTKVLFPGKTVSYFSASARPASAGGHVRDASPGTGVFGHPTYFTNGVTEVKADPTDPDKKTVAPVNASIERDISSVPSGSGITVRAGSSSYKYIKFDTSATSPSLDSASGIWTVNPNGNASATLGSAKITISGGKISVVLPASSSYNNSSYYNISDGIASYDVPPTTAAAAVSPVKTAAIGTTSSGSAATYGSYLMDLSSYQVTDEATLESFIDSWKGKAIKTTYSSYSNYYYDFIDTKDPASMDAVSRFNGIKTANEKNGVYSSNTVDLNAMRKAVLTDGKTIAEAFTALAVPKMRTYLKAAVEKDGSGNVSGIRFTAHYTGPSPSDKLEIRSVSSMRSYSIDIDQWMADNGVSDLENTLNGKGFRFYCATDPNQWFNIVFSNGEAADDDKPPSGTDTQDIKTILVDVSGAGTAEEVVQRIYDASMDILTGPSANYNHNFRMAADGTKLTIYDWRTKNVNTADYTYLSHGAKIADGVMDNVIKDYRYLYVKDVVIQHTTKASANIHVRIPQTTMDQVFGFRIGTKNLSDFNVLTRDMREALLGTDGPPKVEGILDSGLQYLIDANTLIGAQINHMDFAGANITTQLENVTAAESVIRDADMAKTIAAYSRDNILAQAAQSMLAQANQTPQSVISLLQ